MKDFIDPGVMASEMERDAYTLHFLLFSRQQQTRNGKQITTTIGETLERTGNEATIIFRD